MTKFHILDVVKHVIFDLDDTLYINERVPEFVRAMIIDYIEKMLHVPHAEAVQLCMKYYLESGTTLAGLCIHGHSIDFDHWHAHVHGHIKYAEEVRPDPTLRALLEQIPVPKHVFTNADSKHAWICLENLGMDQGLFDHVVHFENLMERGAAKGLVASRPTERGPVTNVLCKPAVKAFQTALEMCGITDPSAVLFCDDSARNIAGAKAVGMLTCIVGRTEPVEGADFAVSSLHELPRVLPGLFGREEPPAEDAAEGEGPRVHVQPSLHAHAQAEHSHSATHASRRRSAEIVVAAGAGARGGTNL